MQGNSKKKWGSLIAASVIIVLVAVLIVAFVLLINGKEDTVILSHNDYIEQQNYISDLEAKISMYNHLAQAQDDIKLGRVQNLDDAFNDILEELDGLEF